MMNNFEYQINSNIFKSIGRIKITDNLKNSYEFSQIYLNEKTKEIVGSDAKLYLNQDDFKTNKKQTENFF